MKKTLLSALGLAVIPVGVDAQVTPSTSCADINFFSSLEDLRSCAEQGDAGAQVSLGSRYSNGTGVPEDDAEAVRWYRLGGALVSVSRRAGESADFSAHGTGGRIASRPLIRGNCVVGVLADLPRVRLRTSLAVPRSAAEGPHESAVRQLNGVIGAEGCSGIDFEQNLLALATIDPAAFDGAGSGDHEQVVQCLQQHVITRPRK